MSLNTIFDAMEAGNWEKAKEEIKREANYLAMELENKIGEREDTLLIKAARLGSEDVIDLLLLAGAHIEARNKVGATALYMAARGDHFSSLQLLLDTGADIEALDFNGDTALMISAFYGHVEVVALLCKRGANIEARDHDGKTSLSISAYRGHVEVATLFCERGANINARDNRGFTALFGAAQEGHCSIVRILLDKGADIGAKKNGEVTPLMVSAENGHGDVVTLLLERGADMEAQTKDGATALYMAAQNGYLQTVELLLNRGANKEFKFKGGFTPLIVSAWEGHDTVVELLLMRGAHIHTRTNEGVTALYCAAQNGHLKVVDILLDKQADTEVKFVDRSTPLIISAEKGHWYVVNLLLNKKANVNAQKNDGRTALFVAAQKGHIRTVATLLDRGANIESKSQVGFTPLIMSSGKGHCAVVALLLNRGANIEAQTNDGDTALINAACYNHVAVVKLLCRKGAKLNVTNNHGHNAFHWAKNSQANPEMAEFLKNWQKQGDTKSSFGLIGKFFSRRTTLPTIAVVFEKMDAREWPAVKEMLSDNNLTREYLEKKHGDKDDTLLVKAARCGEKDIVEMLILAGAVIDSRNKGGATALFVAAQEGYLHAVEFLLDNGAAVEAKDKNGLTALSVAAQRGHSEVVTLLCDRGANIEVNADDGATALYMAAQNGHVEAVETLLGRGAQTEASHNSGATALIVAAAEGKLKVVILLYNRGAKLDARNKFGQTALYWANKNNHPDLADFLRTRLQQANQSPCSPSQSFSEPVQSPIFPESPVMEGPSSGSIQMVKTSEDIHLTDLKGDQLRAILDNLNLSLLAAPFEKYRVDGTHLSSVESPEDILDIDPSIKIVFARTFFGYLTEWRKNDGKIPKKHLVPLAQQPRRHDSVDDLPPGVPNIIDKDDSYLTRIPEHLICPLSRHLFADPVVTIWGNTYERAYIETWFQSGNNTDPITMVPLSSTYLLPNRAIKSAVEEFEKRIAANQIPRTPPKHMTDADFQYAVNVRVSELESANMSKGREIQNLMAVIQTYIVECIPENIAEQLETLDRSSEASDKKKAVELREKQLIEGSPPTLQYYISMQISINGVLEACKVVSSRMVVGSQGSIATAIDMFSTFADFVPFFAKLGLDILKGAINVWDEQSQQLAVERVMNIFPGDSSFSSQVAEIVARKMAIYRKEELEKEAKLQQTRQQKKEQVFWGVKEAIRMALEKWASKGENDHSKVRAANDAKLMLQALMNGDLVIHAGISSPERAEEIAAIILDYRSNFAD